MYAPNDPREQHAGPDVSSQVRAEAWWAGIAALLLLVYAFRGTWTIFDNGGAIFVYTLKGGGIAMAISTVFLLTGSRHALVFDGVASILIGLGLATSAVLAGVDMLQLVFGVIFLAAGWRSLRVYRETKVIVDTVQYNQADRFEAPAESLASRVREQRTPSLIDPTPHGEPEDLPAADPSGGIIETDTITKDPPRPEEPAPEGFLASFADPPPDQRRD